MTLIIIAAAILNVFGQTSPVVGSVKVIGQIQINGKKVVLDRKRFYLLNGNLKQNETLVERLKNAETISRSCFFQTQKTSSEYACWLKTKNFDCESAYCREITFADIKTVPEFQIAYNKGLKQFGGRKELARQWLTTNLTPAFRDGYYDRQKVLRSNLLGDARPVQNIMTDSVVGSALFIDISLKLSDTVKTNSFLISNIVPFEIGDKSYVWACEVEVGAEKQITLKLPDKKNKACEVFVKDLKTCGGGECAEAK